MTTAAKLYPFDSERAIGTLCEVGPGLAKVNLPLAALPEGQWHYGSKLAAGEVGEFVIIDCGEVGVFGRLIAVRLPERDRLSVELELGKHREAHPLGTIQLLATVNLQDFRVYSGMARYPRLGSHVYAAHPNLLKWMAESKSREAETKPLLSLQLGVLASTGETVIDFTPESLFGRHCAVLGATGGGKSWTLARLIEQAAKQRAKVILFDATGEFHCLDCGVQHTYIGKDLEPKAGSTEVVVPSSKLTETDVLALFRPSGQSQAPKLRAAMKSLKLCRLAPSLAPKGYLVKARQPKKDYGIAYKAHSNAVESQLADFDFLKLARQLEEECVHASGSSDASVWGNYNEMEKSYVTSLCARVADAVHAPELACIFKTAGKTSLYDVIEEFIKGDTHRVLRVSLKYLPFGYGAREIVANAVGRFLLSKARDGSFQEHPTVVMLDEAHQFLDKSLGDENSRYALDSFDMIAKEGRKYCLSICIATQRPRDIPEGVLSQMGTLIVHRLTNDHDREVVERASGDIDKSAAAFLPTLGPGHAVIIGVDFAMPLTIKIIPPEQKPASSGPNYQKCWATDPV